MNYLYSCFTKWEKTDGIHNNAVWFYSDPHFNDPEMPYIRKNYIGDDEQVKCINNKVGKHDTIVFLGDIGDLSFIKKIHGYKVLIQGNHDTGKSNYLRNSYTKQINCDDYFDLTPNEMYFKAKEIYPNDKSLQEQYVEKLQNNGYFKALQNLKSSENFKNLTKNINYAFHEPFMSWTAYFDNQLFDEVYDGTLQIHPKILLSHEPVSYDYCLNIHGHDHSNWSYQDSLHLNVCAEHINYTPVNLKDIIKSGVLKNIVDVHREAIDKQKYRIK